MKRLTSILFWSVISAAFIGPGTITTCSTAGARHGYALLWALVFSTFGCLVLQEAAGRVTIVSGRTLAEALAAQPKGTARSLSIALVVGAIVVGCAAYEAGNILGAAAGAVLALPLDKAWITVTLGVLSGTLLWFGTAGLVARVMGLLVALMGAAFIATAAGLAPSVADLVRGALVPTLPGGSGLLIVGLVGTTIVPYNLFLGSGLARGQTLEELRLGLGVAIPLGGLISMAVVVVGTAVTGAFGFDALSATLARQLGSWAALLVAAGLFAAGFSSAVTAPLAAAFTARGLFERPEGTLWQERQMRYRAIWLVVLLAGVGFSLSGVAPVPAIVLAQALNGLLLPIVTAYLLLIVNDRSLMGERGLNGSLANLSMALTFLITVLLGASNLLRAAARALELEAPSQARLIQLASLTALVLGLPVLVAARRRRRRG